ncbi:hypothetical protein ACSBR1_022252 [Camellia fascicularis]
MEKKCVTQHRLEQDRRVQVTESGRERFATLERVQHERCGVYELRRYEDDSGSLCHLLGAVSKGFGPSRGQLDWSFGEQGSEEWDL